MRSTTENPLHVVDIGTGTGLLSMMAATVGADKVTAIEAFDPVASMARKIIALNGLSHKIEVISGRSSDLDASKITEKADIAVAEVFDTELIGENALKTFSEAHKTLLKPDARVIPSRAKFFAQVVQSDTVLDWNTAKPVCLPCHSVDLKVPREIADCSGSDTVHDIQLNQLPLSSFIPVTKPICVFEFDFEKPICFANHKTLRICLPTDADPRLKQADAVFTWWQLDMDGSGQLILSTEPDWSSSQDKVWRDHWIQSVYFLPQSLLLRPDGEFWLHASHDEYSFWFSASNQKKFSHKNSSIYDKPVCSCSLHQILTRNNMARFNDIDRYENFCKAAASNIRGKKCISFGDCSILPIIAVQMGAKEVYALESSDLSRHVIEKYVAVNNAAGVVVVGSMEEIPRDVKFDTVFFDPFSTSAFLPCHNLHFWHLIDDLRQFQMINDQAEIIPDKAKIMILPVEFEHLWKIRAPAGRVEGFDLTPFDNIVQASMQKADCQIEPQPLYEYSNRAMANPKEILEINLTESVSHAPLSSSVEINLLSDFKCNGVVFWIDWYARPSLIDTSGLKAARSDERLSIAGTQPEWRRSYRQGVFFLPYPFKTAQKLSVDMKLDCQTNDATFGIKLV